MPPPTSVTAATSSAARGGVRTSDEAVAGLRACGVELAAILRRGTCPGGSVHTRDWRTAIAAVRTISGGDVVVRQIMVDLAVAADHLADPRQLRAYARETARTAPGVAAKALLGGLGAPDARRA